MSKKSAAFQMTAFRDVRPGPKTRRHDYSAFSLIDGRHPWMNAVPEGFISYPVRTLGRGTVAYFNFHLAREMGLIAENHPNEITPELEETLRNTFSIQIINEYDQTHRVRYPKDSIKPHPYMATRYLQLQHQNKQGKTSGDGRSVWNGTIQHKGKVWDVSSRGTGVTALSPGAVEAQRPLKSGNIDFGYGCGMADLEELFGSAVMSEIFHLQGIPTERVLVIIDIGKGVGIGVRAAPNLLRPAHLFLFLKQRQIEPLRRGTDYLIERQIANGEWSFSTQSKKKYSSMLKCLCADFAKFAAQLERNYIFAWLDWDGDNVLANAGIIDYGSIRQFGLRHDQYRYDDVQRFSTNLNEQKQKARLTLQAFAQLTDFLETGRKRSLRWFANHPILKEYDRLFETHCLRIFLQQAGFNPDQVNSLVSKHLRQVEQFYRDFSVLERMKTKARTKRLPDGINRPAILNMRKALREMPEQILAQGTGGSLPPFTAAEFLDFTLAAHATREDRRLSRVHEKRIMAFQHSYLETLRKATGKVTPDCLKELVIRSQIQNRPGRITGNSAEHIVSTIMEARKSGYSPSEIQAAIELFINQQAPVQRDRSHKIRPLNLESKSGQLFQSFLHIVEEHQEDI